MRRLVIAAAVGAAVVGSAVPSLAAQLNPATSTPTQQLPVTAKVSTNGGVFVTTTIFGNPGLDAAVANGEACVGFSLEVPVCAGIPPITTPAGRTGTPTQQLPPGGGPVIYNDATETAVGVGDLGVVWYHNGTSSGRICPVVSTQDWQCVGYELG